MQVLVVEKTLGSIQELESTNLVKRWIFSDLKPEQVFTGWLKERKGIKGNGPGLAGLGQIWPRSSSAVWERAV
jgi:hypothetical protein